MRVERRENVTSITYSVADGIRFLASDVQPEGRRKIRVFNVGTNMGPRFSWNYRRS